MPLPRPTSLAAPFPRYRYLFHLPWRTSARLGSPRTVSIRLCSLRCSVARFGSVEFIFGFAVDLIIFWNFCIFLVASGVHCGGPCGRGQSNCTCNMSNGNFRDDCECVCVCGSGSLTVDIRLRSGRGCGCV